MYIVRCTQSRTSLSTPSNTAPSEKIDQLIVLAAALRNPNNENLQAIT